MIDDSVNPVNTTSINTNNTNLAAQGVQQPPSGDTSKWRQEQQQRLHDVLEKAGEATPGVSATPALPYVVLPLTEPTPTVYDTEDVADSVGVQLVNDTTTNAHLGLGEGATVDFDNLVNPLLAGTSATPLAGNGSIAQYLQSSNDPAFVTGVALLAAAVIISEISGKEGQVSQKASVASAKEAFNVESVQTAAAQSGEQAALATAQQEYTEAQSTANAALISAVFAAVSIIFSVLQFGSMARAAMTGAVDVATSVDSAAVAVGEKAGAEAFERILPGASQELEGGAVSEAVDAGVAGAGGAARTAAQEAGAEAARAAEREAFEEGAEGGAEETRTATRTAENRPGTAPGDTPTATAKPATAASKFKKWWTTGKANLAEMSRLSGGIWTSLQGISQSIGAGVSGVYTGTMAKKAADFETEAAQAQFINTVNTVIANALNYFMQETQDVATNSLSAASADTGTVLNLHTNMTTQLKTAPKDFMPIDVQLQEHLDKLCLELQIPAEMRTKDRDIFGIRFAGDLNAHFNVIDNRLKIQGLIGPLPSSKVEEFVAYASFANLFGEGTGKSVISIDSAGKNLSLTRWLSYPLTYPNFKEELEVFINYLEIWQKKCLDACKMNVQYKNGLLQPLKAT